MSAVPMVLSIAAGTALLVLLLLDVFVTIFLPRSGAGPVTGRAYRATWWLWRAVAPRAGQRRRAVLGLCGPVLLPLTVLLWSLELVVGFGLVYLPFAPTFQAPPGEELPGWVAALYYSGYSATTLGVGDIHPQGGGLRLLAVVEAALGFSLFSVSITYLISVYAAVSQSASFALTVSRYVRPVRDASVAEVLVEARDTGTVDDLRQWLANSGTDLERVAQSRVQYPLLQYFHISDDDRALPVALTDLLELLTVVQALPDRTVFPALTGAPGVLASFRAAVGYGRERAEPEDPDEDGSGRVHATRQQAFDDAWSVLSAAQVPLRPREEAHRCYLELRAKWDVSYDGLRRQFEYESELSG